MTMIGTWSRYVMDDLGESQTVYILQITSIWGTSPALEALGLE